MDGCDLRRPAPNATERERVCRHTPVSRGAPKAVIDWNPVLIGFLSLSVESPSFSVRRTGRRRAVVVIQNRRTPAKNSGNPWDVDPRFVPTARTPKAARFVDFPRGFSQRGVPRTTLNGLTRGFWWWWWLADRLAPQPPEASPRAGDHRRELPPGLARADVDGIRHRRADAVSPLGAC